MFTNVDMYFRPSFKDVQQLADFGTARSPTSIAMRPAADCEFLRKNKSQGDVTVLISRLNS
jgi:hypothetical protein